MKEGTVLKSRTPEPGEMKDINRYTRREYGPEEVYAFSLALCDNEIDRDFERFSTEALEKLQELFLGKTCIFDHEQKSANQTARIYRTALRRDPERRTRAGEAYVQLTARAYLPRTPGNQEVIELIDSGILKEVSVSCSVKRSVCGLCGKEQCGHEKGKEYPEGVGHRVLCDPTDAYECSFVAVPAQREAGVTKSFREGELEGLLSGEVTKAQADRLTVERCVPAAGKGPVGRRLPGEPDPGRAAVQRPAPAGGAGGGDEVRGPGALAGGAVPVGKDLRTHGPAGAALKAPAGAGDQPGPRGRGPGIPNLRRRKKDGSSV